MINSKFIRNLIQVAFSNGIKFIAGVLTGLVLPIVFDVSGFGYYRLFALYLSYFGLFHFGFIDGIYLLYGGTDYQHLDKNKFRAYTRFIVIVEMFVSFAIIIYSLLFLENERQVVFLLLGVNVFSSLITTYYQFISQATSRFREFSIMNIVYGLLTSILVAAFFFMKINNAFIYLSILVIINVTIMLIYMNIYKEISFGFVDKSMYSIKDFIELFKLGTPLLIGNFVTVLILNLPKQYVDWKFNIEKFAIFSFAYSLMNIANVFVGALSVVIYPTLKKVDPDKFKFWYKKSTTIVILLFSSSLIGFFPLKWVIDMYLPKYSSSIIILAIIFPGLILSSLVQIVKLNYFKALNKMKQYIYSGLITLLFTIISIIVLLLAGMNLNYIAITAVTSMYFWHFVTEVYFISQYKIILWRNEAYIVIISICFYLISQHLSTIFGFLAFSLAYFGISYLIFKKEIVDFFSKSADNIEN